MGRPAKPIDTSDYAGRFSARLRMLREKTGLSGTQIAEAITVAGFKCPERTYYSWEQGVAPPLNVLPTMASCLGVGVRAIFPNA
jgi:transcriptional regulator with XRE-family HTH domain